MGVKMDRLEMEAWETSSYFMGATIRDRVSNFRWEAPTVYGPADHEWSLAFLVELDKKCAVTVLPSIVGGDYNLIRAAMDKSTGVGRLGS
jgi:hypothetical protein